MTEKDVHPTMQRIYDQTGLVASGLASILDIDSQMVYNWDKRGISKQGAFLVSSKLKLDLKWILTGEGVPAIEKILAENPKPAVAMGRWVPVKSYSKMGDDGYYTEMGYLGNGGDGYVPSLTAGPNAYAVRGNGSSMYPAIRHGWYVVCDPDIDPTPTEFVEVRLIDGRRTIKEYIGIVNDVLNLLAVNGEKRMTFDMSDVEAIIAVTDIVPPSRHVHDYPTLPIQDIYYD
ncbi:repressor [Acinetobacter sp. Ac_1271]|nr:repressor [Acinetobacter guerrae]